RHAHDADDHPGVLRGGRGEGRARGAGERAAPHRARQGSSERPGFRWKSGNPRGRDRRDQPSERPGALGPATRRAGDHHREAAARRAQRLGCAESENGTAAVIELKGVTKTYRTGGLEVEVLHGIDLTIEAGEFVAVIGASGSGKSTLMNLLGCLDRPTSGTYRFMGRDVSQLG